MGETFLSDNFVEASPPVDLGSHLPQIGGAWLKNGAFGGGGAGSAFKINPSGQLQHTVAATSGVVYSNIQPLSPDYTASCDFKFQSGGDYNAFGVRMASNALTGYFAYHKTSTFYLDKRVNGSLIQQWTYSVAKPANGTVWRPALAVAGTGATVSLTVSIDGVTRITASDTAADRITATGYVGFHAYDLSPYTISNLTAIDQTQLVAPNNANLFFNPLVWWPNGSTFYHTQHPGNGLKFQFTGSTHCKIGVDVSNLVTGSAPSTSYPYIVTRIVETGQFTRTQLVAYQQRVTVATGLTTSSTYTVECFLDGIGIDLDRNAAVSGGGVVGGLRVTGVQLDAGGSVLPAPLKAKRCLFVGNSFVEGFRVRGSSSNPSDMAGTLSFPNAFARAMDAEPSFLGTSNLGYTVNGATNVPPVQTSWSNYYSGQSRLVSGKLVPEPDYIVFSIAENDYLYGPITETQLKNYDLAMMAALRAAAPNAVIFMLVPPTMRYKDGRLAAVQTFNDAKVRYVYTGENYSTPAKTTDGLHLNQQGAAEFGAAAAGKAKDELSLIALATNAVAVRTEMDANSAKLTTIDGNTSAVAGRITSARAGYLDKLNLTGTLATQEDVNAINQSASRRVILTTVGQYERPESSTTVYTVEARTYSDDGDPMNATGTPTLTATGQTTGSLSANLSAATNPTTGVYRWTYTVSSSATLEPVRMDFLATVDGDSVPMSVYTQVVDFVAATFTTTDRADIQAAKAAAVAADGKATTLVNRPAPLDATATKAAAASALADYDPPTKGEMDTAIGNIDAGGLTPEQVETLNVLKDALA